jgi:hypothetical protein
MRQGNLEHARSSAGLIQRMKAQNKLESLEMGGALRSHCPLAGNLQRSNGNHRAEAAERPTETRERRQGRGFLMVWTLQHAQKIWTDKFGLALEVELRAPAASASATEVSPADSAEK